MHFLIIMSHTNARYRSEENSPGGGQGEDRIDGAAAGGHLKTAMNKIAGKS